MSRIQNLAESVWRQEAAEAGARLALLKAGQKPAFDLLKAKFSPAYGGLKNKDLGKFLLPTWVEAGAELEKVFLPSPSFSFLRQPYIKWTLINCLRGQDLKNTLESLRKSHSQEALKKLLLEDPVGDPFLSMAPYLTSHNSLVHLRSLTEFARATRCDTTRLKTIVEWGGGYGSMARIFKRQSLVANTYIIIDLPIFSCLQWLYLAAIFGEKNIHLLKSADDAIKAGKTNLLPLCFLEGRKVRGDLFLSTEGLSESSLYSQDYVRDHDWFHSKHILLEYRTRDPRIPTSDRMDRLARGAKARRIEIARNHYYAFR